MIIDSRAFSNSSLLSSLIRLNRGRSKSSEHLALSSVSGQRNGYTRGANYNHGPSSREFTVGESFTRISGYVNRSKVGPTSLLNRSKVDWIPNFRLSAGILPCLTMHRGQQAVETSGGKGIPRPVRSQELSGESRSLGKNLDGIFRAISSSRAARRNTGGMLWNVEEGILK